MEQIKRVSEFEPSIDESHPIITSTEAKKPKQSVKSNSATESVKIKLEEDETTENFNIDDKFLRKWTEQDDGKWAIGNELYDCKDTLPIKIEQTEEFVNVNKIKAVTNLKVKHVNKLAKNTDKLIEELCRNFPVSEKLVNSCTFKSPRSSKVLQNWAQLRDHIKVNSECKTKLKLLDVGIFIRKKISYACKICSAKTLCDYIFIRRHLLNKHEMPLEQYKKQFHRDTLKTLRKIDCYSNNMLGNLCVYQCEKCDKKFSGLLQLQKHQKLMSHDKNKYKVIKSTYHKCRLCCKNVICEIFYLTGHMRRYHQISLQDYCAKTNCKIQQTKKMLKLHTLKLSAQVNDLCVFLCRICNDFFYSQGSFESHRQKKKHHLTPPEPAINDLRGGFKSK